MTSVVTRSVVGRDGGVVIIVGAEPPVVPVAPDSDPSLQKAPSHVVPSGQDPESGQQCSPGLA